MPLPETLTLPFKASLLPDDLIINHTLAIDLIWLSGVPILHEVDTHINCLNAMVLRRKSSTDIWHAFVQ